MPSDELSGSAARTKMYGAGNDPFAENKAEAQQSRR